MKHVLVAVTRGRDTGRRRVAMHDLNHDGEGDFRDLLTVPGLLAEQREVSILGIMHAGHHARRQALDGAAHGVA